MKKKLKDYEISAILSRTLYTLKSASLFRRAYTTKEILDACDAVSIHPSNVDNSTIPFVVAWLEKNKGI